jgi:hypothetical protein
MPELSGRERLLFSLQKKPVDRLAFAPLIEGYFMSGLPAPVPDYQVCKECGCEILARHVPVLSTDIPGLFPWSSIKDPNPEVKYQVSAADGQVRVDFKFRGLSLGQQFKFNPESPFIPWITEFLIKSPDDLRLFVEIYTKARVLPEFQPFLDYDRRCGDQGLATATIPATPIQSLVNILAGLERSIYLLADAADAFEEFNQAMHAKNMEVCRVIAQSPALVAISYENTSSSTTGPRYFKKYEVPRLNDYSKILHDAVKLHLIHMCGKLKNMPLELLDADGFVDISPEPTGNITPGEARLAWPEKILLGGIDPISYLKGDPRQLEKLVREIIAGFHGNLKGFILGSSDATPKGTTLQTLSYISGLVRKPG